MISIYFARLSTIMYISRLCSSYGPSVGLQARPAEEEQPGEQQVPGGGAGEAGGPGPGAGGAGGVQPAAGDQARPHDRDQGQDEGDLPEDGHTGAAALST